MVIKEKLKTNRFRLVRIPSKGELFRQYGELNGQATYSGEEVAEAISGTRKSDRYADSENLMKEFDKKRQEEANKK